MQRGALTSAPGALCARSEGQAGGSGRARAIAKPAAFTATLEQGAWKPEKQGGRVQKEGNGILVSWGRESSLRMKTSTVKGAGGGGLRS